MSKRKYFLFVLLFLAAQTGFAHQDFYVIRHFGKVTIRIKTGYQYEEIKKIDLLGQLIYQLSKELNYPYSVFVDLTHNYIGDCRTVSFVAFDKGGLTYENPHFPDPKPLLKENGLVIRQLSREFRAKSLVQLAEYGMSHSKSIAKEQKPAKLDRNYYHWVVNSVDTAFLYSLTERPASQLVTRILSKRLNRPESKDFDSYVSPSYYLKDGHFHIYAGQDPKTEELLLSLTSLYDFRRVYTMYGLVFDSDSSFYFVSRYHNKASKRQIIQNLGQTDRPWEPCKVSMLGKDKIAVIFDESIGPERTVVYLIKEDKLVQNLDEVLKKE